MATQVDSIRTIYSQPEIQERIKEMGQQISSDYAKLEHPVVIGVMKGAFCFLADIVRQIKTPDPLQIEFVRLASYGSATESSGSVQTPYLELPNISRRNILVVEDIIDTGLTLTRLLDILGSRGANSIKLASFLDKPEPRINKELKLDYTGFVIPNEFVVGYGLDAAGRYRNLPFIGVVKNPAEA